MDKQLFDKLFGNRVINVLIFKYVNIHDKMILIDYHFTSALDSKIHDYYGWNLLRVSPHIMAGNNYLEMLKQFLNINKKDYRHVVLKRIFKCAIGGGSLELFKYLLDYFSYCKHYNKIRPSELQLIAVIYNRTDIVEYLFDRYKDTEWKYKKLLVNAPLSGNLGLLKQMVHKLIESERHRHSRLDQALSNAARAGNIDMVQYLTNHFEFPQPYMRESLYQAIRGGSMQVVVHLFNLFKIRTGFKRYIFKAIEFNRFEIAKYIFESKYKQDDSEHQEVLSVPLNLDLEMAKWIHNNFQSSDFSGSIDYASSRVDIEMIKWLHENRTERCTTLAMNTAAFHGRLDIVKWLHENRTEGCTEDAMDNAARNGWLDVVKWLHYNRTEGCTTNAMDCAARNGWLDVVKWLHYNRTEGCKHALDNAATNGWLEVVEWLHNNRSERCTKDTMDNAARYGRLDVVKWLHNNRTEGCTTVAMDEAAGNGFFDVIIWLNENRTEGCTRKAIELATENERNYIADWLKKNTDIEERSQKRRQNKNIQKK